MRRRDFLQQGAALGAGALAAQAAGCAVETVNPHLLPEREVFRHGVASGDPLADAVILWTRVTSVDGAPLEVGWELGDTPSLATVRARGTVTTDADRDFTVKLDVDGLEPATTYYYRFTAVGETSPVGRCRTAPAGGAERLRFAVCSCASIGHGYYNAYRRIAEREDLDLVVHLGDYIYEYATGRYGEARETDPPHEIVTLEDYRRRYARYRRDPDLQELHRQHPVAAVWDDHETANNAWRDGAENHSPDEGAWEGRKAAALTAYLEWMPIREQPDGRLWRKLTFGDLFELLLLDTRIWGRDAQVRDEDDPALEDPARTLLGDDQEAWLTGELAASTTTWRVIGQQVMVGQLPQFLNVDQWDGYPAARERLFAAIAATENVVVLTGDIHSSWGLDLTADPFDPAYDPNTGAGSIGVEVVVPGITSPGFPEPLAVVAEGIQQDNPHMKLVEVTRRGYAVIDVERSRVQADWFHVDTVLEVSRTETHAGGLAVSAGAPFWVRVAEAAAPKDAPPRSAPPDEHVEPPRI